MVNPQSKFTESSRTRVREIKARMYDAGTPVTLQQAYELLAKESGYRTWAAMKTSMKAAEKAINPPEAAPVATETETALDKLRAKARKDFVEMMGDRGYNPASVSSGTAYYIAQDLTEVQVREAFSCAPELVDVDTSDTENQANFGVPRTAVDAMRFAIAVDLMECIDLRPYAELVERYGHPPAVARLHKQEDAVTITWKDGVMVIDGVAYPTTTITSRR